jgi:hypothetical protein
MRKLLFDLIWGCGAAFWIAVGWQSHRLSTRYNAWTTRMRSRSASLSPPPTPRMLEANTRIMTWIIRVAAAWFVALSLLALAAGVLAK